MEHELELTLAWENNVGFSAIVREGDGSPITILSVDENGEITRLWKHYSEAIEGYVKAKMEAIGKDMAQE